MIGKPDRAGVNEVAAEEEVAGRSKVREVLALPRYLTTKQTLLLSSTKSKQTLSKVRVGVVLPTLFMTLCLRGPTCTYLDTPPPWARSCLHLSRHSPALGVVLLAFDLTLPRRAVGMVLPEFSRHSPAWAWSHMHIS